MSKAVYIVNGARTPIGSFLGQFASIPAPVLGGLVIQSALEKAHFSATHVDEVMMGCVLPAGQGQAPARQAMIKAGIPHQAGAVTINKVCGSGLKSVMLAASQILAGEASAVIAGGMESMSLAPFYHKEMRMGSRMGHQTLHDGLILDGLWDPYNQFHMGTAAEMCVTQYHFTREAQDAYAALSYKRSLDTISTGSFKEEIVPVPVPQRKGEPLLMDTDEEPFKGDITKLSTLKPAFQKEGGTVTAGNASSIKDGAAAVLVVSEGILEQYSLRPMARIVASATHSQEPAWFTTAPVGAIQKVLNKAGLSSEEIDLYEINEAFAVVTMAAMADLNLPEEKVNVRGGAISLGHPIGASGARILVTLLHALQQTQKRYGLATLCIGGGEAVAMVVEML